jgi:hypothetical protein
VGQSSASSNWRRDAPRCCNASVQVFQQFMDGLVQLGKAEEAPIAQAN